MDKKSEYKDLLRADLSGDIQTCRFKHLVLDILEGNASGYDQILFNQAVVETALDETIIPIRFDAVYGVAKQTYTLEMMDVVNKEDFKKITKESLFLEMSKAKLGLDPSIDNAAFNKVVVDKIVDQSLTHQTYDVMYSTALKLHEIEMRFTENAQDYQETYQESLLIQMGKANALGVTDVNRENILTRYSIELSDF